MKVDEEIPFAFMALLFSGFPYSLRALAYLYRLVKETLLATLFSR